MGQPTELVGDVEGVGLDDAVGRSGISWFISCCFPFTLGAVIARYSRPAMREIWNEQRKLEIWLQIELLASEALAAQGLVPKKDLEQMKARAAFNVERCKELERTLNHDVVAF